MWPDTEDIGEGLTRRHGNPVYLNLEFMHHSDMQNSSIFYVPAECGINPEQERNNLNGHILFHMEHI